MYNMQVGVKYLPLMCIITAVRKMHNQKNRQIISVVICFGNILLCHILRQRSLIVYIFKKRTAECLFSLEFCGL